MHTDSHIIFGTVFGTNVHSAENNTNQKVWQGKIFRNIYSLKSVYKIFFVCIALSNPLYVFMLRGQSTWFTLFHFCSKELVQPCLQRIAIGFYRGLTYSAVFKYKNLYIQKMFICLTTGISLWTFRPIKRRITKKSKFIIIINFSIHCCKIWVNMWWQIMTLSLISTWHAKL